MKNLKTYPDNWQPVLLHQYFLQYAQISPEAIAIITAKNKWTYQNLHDRAHLYAEILDNCGLAHGDRVILELEPSPRAIALIAACSLLGLIFVPVSPEASPVRVEQIINSTEAKLHIQENSHNKNIQASPTLSGYLEGNDLKIKNTVPEQLRSRKSSVIESDLAYLIFTSGTTGNPKGIMMNHRAALVFFRALVNYCQLPSGAKVGTIAPLQFDFCLLDMGLALGSGATLVQIPRKLALIPPKLLRYLDLKQVTHLNSVSSIWKLLLSYAAQDIAKLQHLQSILFGGEAFAIADIIKLQSLLPQLRMINCFGQSESIACSFTDVPNPLPPGTKNLSIGFAHPGAEMLLLDDKQQEIRQPHQIGEIYLRGANLFSGYWRNPEATNACLVANPLQPLAIEKVFRTRDLAFKGSQGELYFVGRRDLQVKIMGNRVELAEIEGKLREHTQITQACAIAINRQGNNVITVFLIVESNQSAPTEQELRLFCGDLPGYMIPSEIYFVETFPLTINGKVDRKALEQSVCQEKSKFR